MTYCLPRSQVDKPFRSHITDLINKTGIGGVTQGTNIRDCSFARPMQQHPSSTCAQAMFSILYKAAGQRDKPQHPLY